MVSLEAGAQSRWIGRQRFLTRRDQRGAEADPQIILMRKECSAMMLLSKESYLCAPFCVDGTMIRQRGRVSLPGLCMHDRIQV